jgi:hypothetical protein
MIRISETLISLDKHEQTPLAVQQLAGKQLHA